MESKLQSRGGGGGTRPATTKPTWGCVQWYTRPCVIIIQLPPFPSVLI